MRLHTAHHIAALLFGAAQPYVSRHLRRLLSLITWMVPVAEVWEAIGEEGTLLEEEILDLAQLVDRRALLDVACATLIRLYRPRRAFARAEL